MGWAIIMLAFVMIPGTLGISIDGGISVSGSGSSTQGFTVADNNFAKSTVNSTDGNLNLDNKALFDLEGGKHVTIRLTKLIFGNISFFIILVGRKSRQWFSCIR